jgi:purine-binding chemotaxis protein CheW
MPQLIDLAQSYVVFELAGAAYGVSSAVVQQIDMIESATPVPNAPAFLEGVVFTRGAMIPAVNLRVRFGFPRLAFDAKTRLIVVASGNRTVGLIADGAREFIQVAEESIQPPPEMIAGLSRDYLRGIANVNGRLVLIIKIEEILAAVESLNIQPSASQEA